MFLFVALAFVGGVLGLQMLPVLPPLGVVFVLPVLAGFCFLLRDKRGRVSGDESKHESVSAQAITDISKQESEVLREEESEELGGDGKLRGDTHWRVLSASGRVLPEFMVSDKTTIQTIAEGNERKGELRAGLDKLLRWNGGMFGLRFWRRVVLLLLCAAIGFCWAFWRAELRLSNQLPPSLEWRDIVVEGEVKGFAKTDERASRFLFDIERVITPHRQQLNMRARLAFYHNDKPPPAFIIDGAKLRLKVRIRPPRESTNPHGFDYAGWLFANNIRAAGYVRNADNKGVVVLHSGGGLRDTLSRRARRLMADDDNNSGALLSALVVGDRSQMTDAQWRVLRRTGTAHLFAISGAHLSIAAGFAAFLAAFLWRRVLRLTRLMPAQKAALIVAIPMAFAYALLAGMEVPVQRSFLMLAIAAVAVLLGGISQVYYAIAFAAIVIVMIDPWSVLSAGFWLSFAFVAALAAVVMRGGRGLWRRLIRVQFLLSLCAMPLTLWFFNQASLISPLANLAAIPVIGFVVLPLALADIVIPGDALWRIAGFVLSKGWEGLAYLSSLPFAAWQPASPPGWLFLFAMTGAGLLLMPSGFPMRYAGCLPLFAMLLWQPVGVSVGGFRVVVLDVGQGAAVVIKTANHTMLYDTGAHYAFPAVRDYLRGAGVRRLDMMMISHNDNDHSGGADAVLAEFSAARVLASFRLEGVDDIALCQAGQKWEWDGVVFSVLHPSAAEYESKGVSDNDKSCVMHIRGKGESLLLTGDISANAERALLLRYDDDALRADVVNAPHHGSKSSSSSAFINAVRPQAAIFSSGAGNRFRHPHPQVIGEYEKHGAKTYRTDKHGAIIISAPAKGKTTITKWRPQNLHYWHRLRGED